MVPKGSLPFSQKPCTGCPHSVEIGECIWCLVETRRLSLWSQEPSAGTSWVVVGISAAEGTSRVYWTRSFTSGHKWLLPDLIMINCMEFPEQLRVTEMVKKCLCPLGKLKAYSCVHNSPVRYVNLQKDLWRKLHWHRLVSHRQVGSLVVLRL
jgi:hypothetical protein